LGSSLEFRGGGFTNAETQDFSDFFSNLFGGGAFQDYKQHDIHMRGEDTHSKVLIDLGDAYEGNTRQFSFRHVEVGADGRLRRRNERSTSIFPKAYARDNTFASQSTGAKGSAKPHREIYTSKSISHPTRFTASRVLTCISICQ
jgi:curved DNA-binding protein